MNIQSISELNELNSDKSVISQLSNVNAYVEISYPDNSNLYHSYKLPLSTFMTDLVLQLLYLSTYMTNLSANVSNYYVKKAGDVMTGSLSIGNSSGLTVDGTTTFKNNVFCKLPSDKNVNAVAVQDGELICKYDIHGCALTAKWSN